MSKCPSCGKGVPVGAKRCIYCRATVDPNSANDPNKVRIAADPSNTLLGIPGARSSSSSPKAVDLEAMGGNTKLGVGSRAGGPLGIRRPSAGKGVRQTLMGLGSVRLLNDPEEDQATEKSARPSRSPHHTMAGMPGVSQDPRSTMMGMPAIKESAIQKAPQRTKVPTIPVPQEAIDRAQRAIDKQRQQATPPSPVQSAKPTTELAPQAVEEEFDPLAGMIGVQEPRVSSLMDEEVEDLSAAVFGNDFAFNDEDFDFEDDDEEDDFADISFANEALGKEPQPSPGDIPEEDVHHDVQAASAALSNMMSDLEDVMPTEDEAAAALGLDDGFAEDETVADVSISERMAEAERDLVSTDAPSPKAAKSEPEPAKAQPAPKPTPQNSPASPAPSAPSQKIPAQTGSGSSFGIGGGLGILGVLTGLAWLFIPAKSGDMAIATFTSADVPSLILVGFNIVAGLLGLSAIFMKLPNSMRGVVLLVLGIGMGVLVFTAPIAQEMPLLAIAYAAAALYALAGVFSALKKT